MPSVYGNPVLRGFHPDPSVVRVGCDYYLANSTFQFFPAITLHHSLDLVNWTAIGHGISDPAWQELAGLADSHGIWAPDLSWHEGVFYLYATLRLNTPAEGSGLPLRRQLLTKAADPRGPWSKPVYLEVDNIDPSHFVDLDGRHYMVIAPGITIIPLSADGERVVGQTRQVWAGTGERAPEGPHVFFRRGWYYGVLAEGGTGVGHRITMARSRTLFGAWEACPHNPVLRQLDTDSRLQRCGHGIFVNTPDDDWWVLYLAGRNNQGPWSTLGRETALDPVHWDKDGWPHINHDRGPSLRQRLPRACTAQLLPAELHDAFITEQLDGRWFTVRTMEAGMLETGNGLVLHPRSAGATPLVCGPSTVLLRCEEEHWYEAVVSLDAQELAESEASEAGLLCYYDTLNHLCAGLQRSGGKLTLRISGLRNGQPLAPVRLEIESTGRLELGVEVIGLERRFWLRPADTSGQAAGGQAQEATFHDLSWLSDEGIETGKHHTGTLLGVYASRCSARFYHFELSYPGRGSYRNPVLHVDYSDPDVIRHGDDYFLTASSFSRSPGLPVLHSRNLVDWELLGHAIPELPWHDDGRPAHGRAVWAPSLRWHEGWFYIYFGHPDEGVFMTRARDAAGPWTELVCVKETVGWIDPCPFWDDDGSAYLIHAFANSRAGFKSVLQLCRMSPDGHSLEGEARFVYDGQDRHMTMEGPKLYKRDGWYYIFAPAGGVSHGWQTVLRSRNIWGPYEDRIVLHQGSSPVNGPHQGAWVEAPDGSGWFVHFQDRAAYGRVVHLQPLEWLDGWPRIGTDLNNDGIGEPLESYTMPPGLPLAAGHGPRPDGGQRSPGSLLDGSDSFSGPELNPLWFWQGPVKRLAGTAAVITSDGLQLEPAAAQLLDAPNLLLQNFPAPSFSVVVGLAAAPPGHAAAGGLAVMGRNYRGLRVSWCVIGNIAIDIIEGGQTFDRRGKALDGDVCCRPLVKLPHTTDGPLFCELGLWVHEGLARWYWRPAKARLSATDTSLFDLANSITGNSTPPASPAAPAAAWEEAGEAWTCVPGLWTGAAFGLFGGPGVSAVFNSCLVHRQSEQNPFKGNS